MSTNFRAQRTFAYIAVLLTAVCSMVGGLSAATFTVGFQGTGVPMDFNPADGIDYAQYTSMRGTFTLPDAAFTNNVLNSGNATGVTSDYAFNTNLVVYLSGGPGADFLFTDSTESWTLTLRDNEFGRYINIVDAVGSAASVLIEMSILIGDPLYAGAFNVGTFDTNTNTVTTPNSLIPGYFPNQDETYFALTRPNPGGGLNAAAGYSLTSISVIPEPHQATLLALSLLPVIIARRRKR